MAKITINDPGVRAAGEGEKIIDASEGVNFYVNEQTRFKISIDNGKLVISKIEMGAGKHSITITPLANNLLSLF